MTPERWRTIKTLFERSLAIESGQQRLTFLREQSAEDTELFQSVIEMLESESSNKTSSHILQNEAFNYFDSHWGLHAGEQLGSYRIIEKVAEGGMGAVYSAERSDETYTQKVAIKTLRPHVLNAKSIERFNTERQILAKLNHPNIAQIIDAGTTDSDIPYYVMEYIDGLPVSEFAEKNDLSLKQKLDLFKTICFAVEYAHKHLVIHRDIKASNVLISNDGELKLLDFGIAKVMDAEQTDISVTQIDQQVLTPENASPEQIRGEYATTSTDVYMLGVLLYQLLTSNKPFNFKSNSLIEVEKIVCNTRPAKPSKNIAKNIIADHRTRLERQLCGDIDNIILKAMELDPNDRYSSVGALIDDINRFLNYLPIEAKPASWSRRAEKFVRRNRSLVLFCSVFIFTILGFSIFVSLQAYQLKQERNKALTAKKIAVQKSEVAAQSSKFMIDLFSSSDPRAKGTQFTSAKDLLDNARAELTPEKVKDEAVRLELLVNIGMAYRNLDENAVANQILERALKLAIKIHGEISLEVAEIKVRLGDSYRNNNQNERAYELLSSALDIQSRFNVPASYEIADTYNNLAWVIYALGRMDEAIAMQEKSVELHLQYTDDDAKVLAIPFNNLAILYRRVGQYSKSIEYNQRSLTISRANNNSDIAGDSLLNLGRSYRSTGNLPLSLKSFRECQMLWTKLYGAAHWRPSMLDRDIAITLQKMGEMERSKALFLKIEKQLLAEGKNNSTSYAIWEFFWAIFLKEKGDLAEAEKRIAHSIEQQIERYGPELPRVLRYQRELAELYMLNGELDRAELLLGQLLKQREKKNQANHLQIGLIHFSFIKLYSLLGDKNQKMESINNAKNRFEKIDPKAEEIRLLDQRLSELK